MSNYYRQQEPDKVELVRLDGVAREVRCIDQDGVESIHMYFRDGQLLRSCPIEDWESERASLIMREAEKLAMENMRNSIISEAQGAVGVHANQVNAVQLRSLLALLLMRDGALDKDGAIRSIDQWIR